MLAACVHLFNKLLLICKWLEKERGKEERVCTFFCERGREREREGGIFWLREVKSVLVIDIWVVNILDSSGQLNMCYALPVIPLFFLPFHLLFLFFSLTVSMSSLFSWSFNFVFFSVSLCLYPMSLNDFFFRAWTSFNLIFLSSSSFCFFLNVFPYFSNLF